MIGYTPEEHQYTKKMRVFVCLWFQRGEEGRHLKEKVKKGHLLIEFKV